MKIMDKFNYRCPKCGGKLKLDIYRIPLAELFVLSPSPRPLIAIYYCEKCGEAIHINPADFEWKSRYDDSLCLTCIYGKRDPIGYLKCTKFNRSFSSNDKVVKCDFYVEKKIENKSLLRKILIKVHKLMVRQ